MCPAMTRLHVAPSARCERHTTIAETLQMTQVPRCGRVDREGCPGRREWCWRYRPDRPAHRVPPRTGSSRGHAQRAPAAEVVDRERGRDARVELLAGGHLDEGPARGLHGGDATAARPRFATWTLRRLFPGCGAVRASVAFSGLACREPDTSPRSATCRVRRLQGAGYRPGQANPPAGARGRAGADRRCAQRRHSRLRRRW